MLYRMDLIVSRSQKSEIKSQNNRLEYCFAFYTSQQNPVISVFMQLGTCYKVYYDAVIPSVVFVTTVQHIFWAGMRDRGMAAFYSWNWRWQTMNHPALPSRQWWFLLSYGNYTFPTCKQESSQSKLPYNTTHILVLTFSPTSM